MRARLSIMCAAVSTLALMCIGCGSGDTAVPRRTAYPRIALYDSVYSQIGSLPIRLDVNSHVTYECQRRPDGAWWLNLHYPSYGVTIYCTLTPVDAATVDAVIDNRAERLHRNIAQAQAEISDIDSPAGYHSNLVVARGGSTAPVQFLSVNPRRPSWVVSGTAFFDGVDGSVAADSVAPIVDALIRDVQVMLNGIADKD